MKITKTLTSNNEKDWRKWLEKNHNRGQEIWLVYYKPARGNSNIDYGISVEEALCFDWIDSIIQQIGEEKYAGNSVRTAWAVNGQKRINAV